MLANHSELDLQLSNLISRKQLNPCLAQNQIPVYLQGITENHFKSFRIDTVEQYIRTLLVGSGLRRQLSLATSQTLS
jgi:hypothetical protein